MWRGLLGLILTLGAFAVSCAAPIESTTASFQGKTIRILVGVGAGGGYDVSARLFAPSLARHVPGEPNVIVENMVGAGGLVATNYLAHQAPRDGTTLALLSGQSLIAQLVGDPAVRYDMKSFAFIGSPGPDEAACVGAPEKTLDLESWKRRTGNPPRFGVTNYGATTHVYGAMLAAALRLPIRFIVGYRGTAEIRMALENGELDGVCVAVESYQATFTPKGRYALLVRTDADSDPDLDRVPAATALVQDPSGREWLDVLRPIAAASRLYALPPDTPESIRAIMRRAFAAAISDSAFVAASAAASIRIRPIDAARVESSVAQLIDLPPETRGRIVALISSSARRE